MNFKFDFNGLYHIPLIKICNPNKNVLGFISTPHGLKISPTFNNTTDLSFSMYSDEINYDLISKYMIIHAEGFGYFIITNVDEDNDGTTITKNIECQSYEVSLNDIGLLLYNENDIEVNPSYYLYNPLSTSNSLLKMIVDASNGWSIGEVDATLFTKQRQFDMDEVFAYEFLMGDIQTAFGCYFIFDTENMTISAYDKSKEGTQTDIILTFDNLLKNISISTNSEDICTALSVYGAEGVTINDVNPLGTNTIYNFTYFKDSTKYMSQNLITAINTWETKIQTNTSNYNTLCNQRLAYSRNKILLNSQLTDLKSDLKGIEQARSLAIEAADNDQLAILTGQYTTKESEIYLKEQEIVTNNTNYTTVCASITIINNDLSFANNFTTTQYAELRNYIKTGTYENENFILTETIENDADLKVDQQKQLLEQAKVAFALLSKPLYEFSMNVNNFLFSKDYKSFISQIELGAIVHAEVKHDKWVHPRLLKIELDYDNPENVSMTFSESFRLQSSTFIFEDSYNETTKSSGKVAVNASSWNNPVKTGFYNTVGAYINNAFDLAKQEILATENQDFQIGDYGIIGKKKTNDDNNNQPTYSNEQIRISNNLLTFTDDGWQSVKTAIGKVHVGDIDCYGLVAEAVVGELIAGEQLLITGETSSFSMIGSDCNITNANLTITTSDNKGRIILSPDLTAENGGISIEGYREVTTGNYDWVRNFYVDGNGDLIANNIIANSGSIGGWNISEDGLSDGYNNSIKSDGTGKLSLMTWNQNSATFDGNIYANNLYDGVGGSNIFVNAGSSGSLGSLVINGGWLQDGSISALKLDTVYAGKVYADETYATRIYADEINTNVLNVEGTLTATNAVVSVLDAYYLNVKNFLAENGTFSGMCEWGTEGSWARIKAELTGGALNAYKMYITAIGGVEISSSKGTVSLLSCYDNASGTRYPVNTDFLHVDSEFTVYLGNDITKIDAYGILTHDICLSKEGSSNCTLTNNNGCVYSPNTIKTASGFDVNGNTGVNSTFTVTGLNGNNVNFVITGGIVTSITFN